MVMPHRRPRDLDLLDKIDAYPKEQFTGRLWRVVREGRDPLLGSRSESRWCNGEFDVLYTSLHRDGAVAEIHALLSLQPVFPSKMRSFVHQVVATSDSLLRLADFETLKTLGVDTAKYDDREYIHTQAIADAAFFLGFEGLIVPNARWKCMNAVLFTEKLDPTALEVKETEQTEIDWASWRRNQRGRVKSK